MDKKMLTAGELAERWRVGIPTITALTESGKLRAVIDGGEGSHKKYAIAYIEKVEQAGGLEEVDKYDLLSVKKLEAENERLRLDNGRLKMTIDSFIALAIQKRSEVM